MQNAWAGHVNVSCQDVTSQVEFGLKTAWNQSISRWTKRSIWLRTDHCRDSCPRLPLRTPSGGRVWDHLMLGSGFVVTVRMIRNRKSLLVQQR